MTSGLLSLKWNNHRSTFFHVLSTIRHKESYNDATLACDGRFYPVHKLVLSTCSEYFEQMFERTQCKHPVIVLKDIKGDDLEALLNYMYIGEVNVLQNDLAGLIKAAECLRIKGLAVPDEAPNAKDTREAKRLIVTEESPQPKRRRREEDGSFSQSQSSVHSRETSHKEHSGISSPRRKTRLSQSPSSAVAATSSSSSTTSSLPSASQPPPSGESAAPAEESLASHPASEEERPAAQEAQGTEAEGGGDKEREKGYREENSSHLRQTVPEVILDESVVKEEPQESADDIEDTKDSLHTGSSNVAFEHMGSDSVEGHDHMSAGYDTHAALGGQPQTMEELVAQAIPGSSGIQANSLPWDSEGNLANFPLESFGGDASQGRPPQLGGALGSSSGGSSGSGVHGEMGVGVEGVAVEWGLHRYACPLCMRRFPSKSDLNKHIRTHTGEKPFPCPRCPYRATQSSSLHRHVRTVHRKEQQQQQQQQDEVHHALNQGLHEGGQGLQLHNQALHSQGMGHGGSVGHLLHK